MAAPWCSGHHAAQLEEVTIAASTPRVDDRAMAAATALRARPLTS
jgi:hypothetical protein